MADNRDAHAEYYKDDEVHASASDMQYKSVRKAAPPQSTGHGPTGGMNITSADRYAKPSPHVDIDYCEDEVPSAWPGSKAGTPMMCVPAPGNSPGFPHDDHRLRPLQLPHPGLPGPSHIDFDSSPSPWSPFESDVTTAESSDAYDSEHQDSSAPRAVALPITFRLEQTNFLAKAANGGRLDVSELLSSLRVALEHAQVDVVEFRPAHCVLECSYHQGNVFLRLVLRVFKPPTARQVISYGDVDSDEEENAGLLVEAQLREGDGLHFSALFRDMMKFFKSQDDMCLAGTYRYQPRPQQGFGDGLVLGEASLEPSRNSMRVQAERNMMQSAATPMIAARRMVTGDSSIYGYKGASPPLPAGMGRSSIDFNSDTAADIMLMAGMLRGSYLDVQADSATAIAGVTANDQLLEELCEPTCREPAQALASSAVYLLVETRHRPARRQASVIVANMSTKAELREVLLASGLADSQGSTSRKATTSAMYLINTLVSMVVDNRTLGAGMMSGSGGNRKEEEIGTRRQCMRALAALSKCPKARDTPAMQSLLTTEPTGRGATDPTLRAHLNECRDVLRKHVRSKSFA